MLAIKSSTILRTTQLPVDAKMALASGKPREFGSGQAKSVKAGAAIGHFSLTNRRGFAKFLRQVLEMLVDVQLVRTKDLHHYPVKRIANA